MDPTPEDGRASGIGPDADPAHRGLDLWYRRLFEAVKDSVFVLDPETMRFVDANGSACQNLGYTRGELLALSVPDVAAGLDHARFESALAKIGETGHAILEGMHQRKDGSTYPIEVSLSQLATDRRYLVAVVHEITERHQAEEALRHEQTLFRNLCDAIPDNIYFKDRQSRFVRINAAMARNFGLRQVSDAVGKTDFDIFASEHARQAYADEQRLMETGEPIVGIEERETWPGGRVTWVSSTKMPLRDELGRITGLVGISRDITERRLSEERLREQNEILSNSHEGVMIVNLDNEVTLWNHGAEEMFGWTAAEALGRQPEQVLGIKDTGLLATMRTAVNRDGFWSGELRLKASDGRELIVESRITLVRDSAGQPRARLSILADITEKKLLEEKFLHAQRLENIGMLASGIAHDLNNVLAPIMFTAPLLRDSLSDPADLKVLDTLEQSAERGAGLVKQILGFVHRTVGDLRPTQVRHLAQDIANLVGQTFPKSIQLKSKLSFDLWPVMGDATQIHQVLLNLCVNARDAMPEGGTLRIAASNARLDEAGAAAIPGARPGAWCVLEVSDTGGGIPLEIMKNIWKPFFTTKGAGKGTGLGLTTIRGIVSSHNGFIELQTEAGHGTTFRIYLPAIEGYASHSADAHLPKAPEGHGELILVVDDDAAIRDVVAAALEKQGYSVVRCADGREAVAMFRSQPGRFSLVVTDADMPQMGGAELARRLLELRPEVRILGMGGLSTSDGDDPETLEIQRLAHGFLHKPFTVGELLCAVHDLLRAPRQQD